MIQSIHMPNIWRDHDEKNPVSIFPALPDWRAVGTWRDRYFFRNHKLGFLQTRRRRTPIDRFTEQAAQFLLQQQQAGTLPAPSSPLNTNRFFSHWLDARKGFCSNSLSQHNGKIQQPPAADFDTVGYYTYVLTQLYPTEARQRQMWGILENTLADAPDLLQRIHDNWQQLNSPQQSK